MTILKVLGSFHSETNPLRLMKHWGKVNLIQRIFQILNLNS